MSATIEPEFDFTASQDWFTGNIPIWGPFVAQLKSSLDHAPRALEVGSWEGRSATYILRTLCTTADAELVCVDHVDLLKTEAGRTRYARLQKNLALAAAPGGASFRVIDDFSVPALMRLLEEEIACPNVHGGFDFVYLDGSHEADDTLLDAELAWRITAAGALFILDDYEWNKEPAESTHHPKRGIDAFLELHRGQYEMLHKGYQVILRKTAAPRVGFLCKAISTASAGLDLARMDYGVHLALCVDEGYAIGAAVTIYSAVANMPSATRISIYVVDCGMCDTTWERLKQSASRSDDERVTFVRIELDTQRRGRTDPTWAKVDMLELLPVERALYLDADVLVRHDLTPLWNTDLRGRYLAAARDIGYPLGHDELVGSDSHRLARPYFNAGVMVLDLARIRSRLDELKSHILARPPTKYKDQDVLNVFLGADDWLELELTWNATGLGTYSKWAAPDRDVVWPRSKGELLKLHEDPAVVHFTGPVNPALATVLNEYVQPWTSKPWGYAGAPGNPFTEEWWEALQQTAWKSYRNSEEHRKACEEAKQRARDEGFSAFEKALAHVQV